MSVADTINVDKFTNVLKDELLKTNNLNSTENNLLKEIVGKMSLSFVDNDNVKSDKKSESHTGGKRKNKKSKLRRGRKNKKSSLRLKSYSFTN